MIAELNTLIERIEARLADDLDPSSLTAGLGLTDYHLRRMFSSLAGMPLSEYIRRRRMAVAAADVMQESSLLDVAVRYGYGSTEAFGRAFQAVHGVSPAHVRQHGGPLRSQPQLRFRLTVEGHTSMHTRLIDRPAFRLVGHATRVPLQHEGVNPHIQAHIASLPLSAHERLKALSSAEPAGILQVTDGIDPDAAEGSDLSYLHGVAVTADDAVADDLDVIDVPAGMWAVFRTEGEHPAALQAAWAATASEWFPSQPWQLRPGPSLVAILARSDDFTTATCELWLPVERG